MSNNPIDEIAEGCFASLWASTEPLTWEELREKVARNRAAIETYRAQQEANANAFLDGAPEAHEADGNGESDE